MKKHVLVLITGFVAIFLVVTVLRFYRIHNESLQLQELRPVLVRCCSELNLRLIEERSPVAKHEGFSVYEKIYVIMSNGIGKNAMGGREVFSQEYIFSDNQHAVSIRSIGYGDLVFLIKVSSDQEQVSSSVISILEKSVHGTRLE